VVVARELTKLHEEFLRGTARSIISILEQRAVIKGEITLLIGGGEKAPFDPENVTSRVATLLTNGVDRMDAIKQVAREFGVSKSEVYRLVEDLRSNANKV
jgi:16S rRNA (cytidine1402-2'-O)-methyltransferase